MNSDSVNRANAIRALNQGAKLGNFAHDTGEGSISPTIAKATHNPFAALAGLLKKDD